MTDDNVVPLWRSPSDRLLRLILNEIEMQPTTESAPLPPHVLQAAAQGNAKILSELVPDSDVDTINVEQIHAVLDARIDSLVRQKTGPEIIRNLADPDDSILVKISTICLLEQR